MAAKSCLMCPSAQPEMSNPLILGVRSGSPEAPRISYLEHPVPASPDLISLAHPLNPTEVYRFVAHCEENACRHFDGVDCKLASRIVQILPAVVDTLPACRIRPTCRWFQQEGRAACIRCPQVITQVSQPSAEYQAAATPE